jgi:hypothetical protein
MVVAALRILLVLAFTALLAAQVVALPDMLARLAAQTPDLAPWRWALLAAAVLQVVCVQVVVVCTWRLLTMVRDDRIFTEASLVWVNPIVVAVAVAWMLLLAELAVVVGGGLPGSAALLVVLLLVVVAVVGLLMVVMRALLRQATRLRSELETVI